MQSLNDAIKVLKANVKEKPVSYWKKNGYYVFRMANTESIGCGFYKVEGNTVTGTNPMHEDLEFNDMINL